MRAVTIQRFGDLDAAGLEERPDPVPGEHEVLVEVRAAPVNYVDLVTMRGEYQFVPELRYVPRQGTSRRHPVGGGPTCARACVTRSVLPRPAWVSTS